MKALKYLLLTSVILTSCGTNTSLNEPLGDSSNAQGVQKNYIPWGTSETDWGQHSQIAATYEEYLDIQGNKDAIWNNEDDVSGTVNTIGISVPLVPLFQRGKTVLKAEFSPVNLIKTLSTFRQDQESKWGQAVTKLNLSDLKYGQLFAVQKVIYLTRMNRTPDQVTEGFLSAKGSVNGETIAPRDIFWQRFKPTTSPNGKIVVVSPGFLESGRNFYEQTDKLNKLGFDVLIIDHQWAGQTKGGKSGLVDRGFGVARDVASATAFANSILTKEYTSFSNKEVIILGNSMGAGPGALGAVTLNDNGKINLEGNPMPIGIKTVLQAPFMGSTENVINSALSLFSKVPFAKNIQLYNIGVPILTLDKTAAQKAMQISLLEDTRAQAQTMTASNKDIDIIMDMIKSGKQPKGKISIIHAKGDPLADFNKSIQLSKIISSDKLELNVVDSKNHVLEQSPSEQDLAIKALLKIEK